VIRDLLTGVVGLALWGLIPALPVVLFGEAGAMGAIALFAVFAATTSDNQKL